MPNGPFDEEQDAPVQVMEPQGGIIPGGGTATIGTKTMPFNRQVWDASDWQRYVQRANAYEAEKRKAEENREFMDMLAKNAAVMRSQQAVNTALTFQAMRGFERDLQAAKSSGLSDEQAFVQAASRNSRAFGGGTGAASVINASRTPFTPTETTIAGAPAVRSGRYGERVQFPPQPRAEAGLRGTLSAPEFPGMAPRLSVSGPVEQVQEYQRTNRPAVSAPRTEAPIKIRRKSDGRTGIYRGNPRDIPSGYEIVR